MRCQSPKCKGTLKTKRTIAQGNICKRERGCPKCKKTFWTIELPKKTYDDTFHELKQECWREEEKRENTELKLENLKEALRDVLELPGKK